jgi:hypothetical protein
VIDAFTIVPAGAFGEALARLDAHVAKDAGVLTVRSGADTAYYFAGDEFVRRALRTTREDPSELACVRAHVAAGVLHVSALGYEGSVAHLFAALAWILAELGPCAVYDDATGEDVSAIATRFPSTLLFPGAEAVNDRSPPRSEIRSVRPDPPAELAGMIDVPMPGVRPSRTSTPPPAPEPRVTVHRPPPADLSTLIDVPIPGVRSRR